MQVVSINIGQRKKVTYQGKEITTSIYKEPVNKPQQVLFHSLAEDTQSDKKHHGGIDKAIYAYAEEYYSYWKKELGREDLSFGMFGENLTTKGLLDDDITIGSTYQIDNVIIQAIQPRFPCSRLNIRFEDNKMVKKFAQSRKHGIYFKVLQEGVIQNNSDIQLLNKMEGISILDVVNCYYNKEAYPSVLSSIRSHSVIPKSLKDEFC